MSTFEEMLARGPLLRRSVIDPETGNAVVSPGNEPDPTEIVQRGWVLPVGRTRSGAVVPAAQAPVATLGQLAGGVLSALPDAPAEAAHAVRFFGDVAAGRKGIFDPATGHVSDEAMSAANAAAGLAMTGSLPFSVPAGSLRTFGGRAARTADHAALDKAADLQASGAAPDAIWGETGWGLGRDGVARFEIPDDGARLRPHDGSPSTTLGRILDHPALFEAYPAMRDVQVFHRPELGSDAAANPSRNWIAANLDDAQALPALLHEGQHIVQRREGFAPGASPIDPALAAHPQVAEVASLRQRLTGLADPQAEALASRADQAARLEAYRTAAGEVEARNVEARQGMTAAERAATPPWRTQDIPANRQWLPQSGGVTGDAAQLKIDPAGDPFAALEAALAKGVQEAEPELRAGPRLLDPNAKSWDLYHGSTPGEDFARFDPTKGSNPHEQAVFFAPNPETASGYAGRPKEGAEAGARVYRTTVEPGKTGVFDLTHLAETDPAFNARARAITVEGSGASYGPVWDDHMSDFRASRAQDADIARQIQSMGMAPDPNAGTRISFGHGHIGAAIERAKAQGLDTAILRGLVEHGGDDQVVALTPGRVRSAYAPDQLLYSGGPGAAVPAATAATAADPSRARRTMANPFDDLDAAYPAPSPAPSAAGAGRKAGPFDDLDEIPLPKTAPAAGDGSAAVGRGIIEGVPIVGPYLLAGVNRAAAGVRSLKNDTKFSDELHNVETFGDTTAKEHPWATTGGEILGGVAGTAPLVAAAPVAFGAGSGPLLARAGAAALGGGALGAADSAVRSEGDEWAMMKGAGLGAALGAAGPVAGKVIGAGARALTGRGRTNALVGEALEGISDKDLTAAQQLIEQARNLPGAPVHLTLDEALNAVTGGQAGRASQLARVVANSGGEGGRIMNEVYAGRPAAIDNAGRESLERIAPGITDPTGLGFDIQDAARKGVAQTPEGMALTAAREATGPRVSADQAGQVIQPEMAAVRDRLTAKRAAEADRDYAAAREAPETVGIERQVTAERPGEPVVTQGRYSRPQFTDDAPRPLDPPPTVEAQASAGPESLARFIAKNGGIRLDGDAAATDLHKFNIPGLGNVARPNGRGIDNFWRERLVEEGYFRPDADGGMARDITNDLLRRLQNEQRGVPSYPIGQERTAAAARAKPGQVEGEYRAALSEAETRLDGDLTKAGVDPASLHPDIRSRVLGAMMRGEEADPLRAYERTVAGMKEAPEPFSKSTSIRETIPDTRFGQANPQPVVDYLDRLLETAKGPAARALGNVRKMLFTPNGRDLDLTVEGLHNARSAIGDLIAKAQPAEQRALMGARDRLDQALGAVPEYDRARSTFAANSQPLAPFEGEAPLAQVTRRDATTKRLATPTEEVPSHLMGATATREFLANAPPASRQAHADHVVTRIMDAATDKHGVIDADKLHTAIRDQADVLAQMPEAYRRLDGVVVAQDGMARVMASPLGRLAKQDPSVGKAVDALFPANPGPGTQAEIAKTVGDLARNRPLAARQLVRHYLEATFNEATQDLRGLPAQYGGAGFASAVRGNAQQRNNLEAALRALPDGDTAVAGMNRLFQVLDATGYRPRAGSDTAFNTEIQKRLKDGTGTLGRAITEVASSAAAGAGVGGPSGALGGGALGAKRAGAELMQKSRMARDGAAIARILTDPKAIQMLDRLSKQPEGSRGAELLTTKLLQMGSFGAAKAAQTSPSPVP